MADLIWDILLRYLCSYLTYCVGFLYCKDSFIVGKRELNKQAHRAEVVMTFRYGWVQKLIMLLELWLLSDIFSTWPSPLTTSSSGWVLSLKQK